MILRSQAVSQRMRIILGVSIALIALAGQINAQTNEGTATPQDTTAPQQTSALPTLTTNSDATSNTATSQPTNTGGSSSTDALPQLTSSAELPHLTTKTGLPAITQDTANLPKYQITIPSNANNPFLQSSSYPDGTVFIIVGSCLAGLALIAIAWRSLYVWCLHRQTKQYGRDLKYTEIGEQRPYSTMNPGGMGMAASNPFASTISLDYLRPGDRASRVSTARPSSARRPSTSGLSRPMSSGNPLTQSMQFYSPSAHPGGTTAAAIATQPGQRDSSYLPAGYYLRDATTSASPRQIYSSPSSSFLADSSAPPMPRLTRTSSGNTIATMLSTRPQTAGATSGYGIGARPSSSRDATPNQGFTQPPLPRPISNLEEATFAGDRRSKPTQFLDDLLGGR
jgi:hypothetical protein